MISRPTQRARITLGVSTVACLSLCLLAGSAGAKPVVPKFTVAVTAETTTYKGHDATIIRQIAIKGKLIGRTSPSISCESNSCVRLLSRGPAQRKKTSSQVKWTKVNWILGPSKTVTIAVNRRGYIGRFVRIKSDSRGQPVMVVAKSGCLKKRKARKCPKGTSAGTPAGSKVSPTLPPRQYFGFASQWTFDWGPGAGTDLQPIVGDFNGDGTDDIGLRRISSGLWYFRPGSSYAAQLAFDWAPGAGTDLQPIVGDVNGDGVDEIGLRRISSGTWYFRPG